MSTNTSTSSAKTKSVEYKNVPYQNIIRHAIEHKAPEHTLIRPLLKVAEKHTVLFDVLINIFLVSKGARTASLIETANFPRLTSAILPIAEALAAFYDLEYQHDKTSLEQYPRYFVYTKGAFNKVPDNDTEIGKALEMQCPGANYGNQKVKRFSGHITELITQTPVFAEVCPAEISNKKDLEKGLRQKVKKFNEVCKSLDLPYSFTYHIETDDGTAIRMRHMMMNDISYMNSHFSDYDNDFYNSLDEPMLSMIVSTFKKSLATKQEWLQKKKMFIVLYYFSVWEPITDNIHAQKLKGLVHELLNDPQWWNKSPEDYCKKYLGLIKDGAPLYQYMMETMSNHISFLQYNFI